MEWNCLCRTCCLASCVLDCLQREYINSRCGAGICWGGDGLSGTHSVKVSSSGPPRNYWVVNRAEKAVDNCSWACGEPFNHLHGRAYLWSGCSCGCNCDASCEKHSWYWPDSGVHHSSTEHWHLWGFWWGKKSSTTNSILACKNLWEVIRISAPRNRSSV